MGHYELAIGHWDIGNVFAYIIKLNRPIDTDNTLDVYKDVLFLYFYL